MSDWSSGYKRSWIRKGQNDYPNILLDLPNPPEGLYVIGDVSVLRTPMVAIVGSRRATPYGLAAAELAATIAVDSSLTVVSGGAHGCDSKAQEIAAEAGARVVSVCASGPDIVYPRGSEENLLRILGAGGAIISEYEWGTKPARWRFSERNRIIVALARLIFIAEAALPSGTFLAANIASELSRTLVATPGSIFSPESEGANYLLSDIATPIWNPRSLREMIALTYESMVCPEPTHSDEEIHDPLLRALIADPMDADSLSDALGIDIVETIRLLSAYEGEGSLVRLQDGRYAPTTSFLRMIGG